ncbi:MAG TPA: hypothetical protein VD788_00335 [Candidatus Polarisedimenticolaceae bacterium]|nr:hypothetical protein [Candidatus Polarisedimenticolaceae bacterium]
MERLGTIRLSPDGTCTLDTPGRELQFLDARVGHNVLLFLIAWNDVGVFSVDTQQALEALRRKHRIRRVLRAPPASPVD